LKTTPPKQYLLILCSQLVFAASIVFSTAQGSMLRSIGRNGGFREALFFRENRILGQTTLFLVLLMLICGATISFRRKRFDLIIALILTETVACFVYATFAH
jgi:hypothetical protein